MIMRQLPAKHESIGVCDGYDALTPAISSRIRCQRHPHHRFKGLLGLALQHEHSKRESLLARNVRLSMKNADPKRSALNDAKLCMKDSGYFAVAVRNMAEIRLFKREALLT